MVPAEKHGTAPAGRPSSTVMSQSGCWRSSTSACSFPGYGRQLSQASRRPDLFTTYVPVQLEVRVVGPPAGAEPAGKFVKALPETGHPVHATGQQFVTTSLVIGPPST